MVGPTTRDVDGRRVFERSHEHVGNLLPEVDAILVAPAWQTGQAGRVTLPLEDLAQLADFSRERERDISRRVELRRKTQCTRSKAARGALQWLRRT